MSIVTPSAPAPSLLASASLAGLHRGLTAVARAWKARRGLRRLEALDDVALKDIGLSRADLGHAARFGRTARHGIVRSR